MALNFIVVTVVLCLFWYLFRFSTYKVGLLEIYFTSTFAYFSVFISFSNNKSVYHFSTIFCACHNKSHNGLSCYFLGRWQEKVTTKGNLTDVSTSGLLSASSRPYDGQQSLFSQHKCLPQKTLMMVKEQNPHKLHRKMRTLLQIKV